MSTCSASKTTCKDNRDTFRTLYNNKIDHAIHVPADPQNPWKFVWMCPHHLRHVCICFYSLSETYEQKRQEHIAELQKKEEEMRQTFVIKVKEKEAELKDAEKDVSFYNIVYRKTPLAHVLKWLVSLFKVYPITHTFRSWCWFILFLIMNHETYKNKNSVQAEKINFKNCFLKQNFIPIYIAWILTLTLHLIILGNLQKLVPYR